MGEKDDAGHTGNVLDQADVLTPDELMALENNPTGFGALLTVSHPRLWVLRVYSTDGALACLPDLVKACREALRRREQLPTEAQ